MTKIDSSPEVIAALMDGVTAGPWVAYGDPEVGLENGLFSGEIGSLGFGPLEPLRGSDLMFTAAARDLLPALAAERDALTAEVARLRDALDAEIKALVAERLSELLEQRWRVAKASERDHLRAALAALKGGDA